MELEALILRGASLLLSASNKGEDFFKKINASKVIVVSRFEISERSAKAVLFPNKAKDIFKDKLLESKYFT